MSPHRTCPPVWWAIENDGRPKKKNARSSAGRIAAAAKAVKGDQQLDLGRLVVEELEQYQASTAELAALAHQAGCSLRTLWYAADVYRLAKRLDLSNQDVARLGRTKLAVVAAASQEIATKRELEELCRGQTVTELRAFVSGRAGAVKTVVFTLNKSQRTVLEAALVRFGARRSGRSLQDKEQALMKLVADAASS
jgi:hypothetical protein